MSALKNLKRIIVKQQSCFFTTCIVITSIFTVCFAQTDNDKLDDILAKIEEVNGKINTLKADFTQTVLFESTKEKREITGTMFFKKPNNIYIRKRTPQEQQLYIDDKNITIYTKANKQAVIEKLKNTVGSDFTPAYIVNFGNNFKKIKKTNSIILGKENEKYFVLKIASVKNKNYDTEVYILKATMRPVKIIVKSEDAVTEIALKIHSVNAVLDKNIFKFIAPKNIEVIKLN